MIRAFMLLTKPLTRLGGRFGLSSTSIVRLLVSIVSIMPAIAMHKVMLHAPFTCSNKLYAVG